MDFAVLPPYALNDKVRLMPQIKKLKTKDLPATMDDLQRFKTDIKSELKAGFDRMERGFDQMDSRFDRIDQHFDRVDRHFDRIDQHFDRMDSGLARLRRLVEEDIVRFTIPLERFVQKMREAEKAYLNRLQVKEASRVET